MSNQPGIYWKIVDACQKLSISYQLQSNNETVLKNSNIWPLYIRKINV